MTTVEIQPGEVEDPAGGLVTLTGPGGLLSGIIGQVLQAGLAAELDAHLDGEGLADFAVVQSYLSTASKWGISKLDALRDLFNGNAWMPPGLEPSG